MYETYQFYGKRQFTYCIAVSKDEIRDVTWRYTKPSTAIKGAVVAGGGSHCLPASPGPAERWRRAVLNKRTLVKEAWLSKTISQFTDKAQETLTKTRRDGFTARR